MTTVAVTGASGFIGRQLVIQLEAAGHKVHALRRPAGAVASWEVPTGTEVLIHLAGRAHVLREKARDPMFAFRAANVVQTIDAARAAAESGVRRFVFVSSAGVLGSVSPPEGFSDVSQPQPHDAYSRSKWEAEQWLQTSSPEGLQVVVIRPPLVYGPGAHGNFARILEATGAGWPLPVGALRAPRSLVGLRNLCDFIVKASFDARATGRTMLVADLEVTCIADLAAQLTSLAGRKSISIHVPVPLLAALLSLVGRNEDAVRLTQPFVLHPHQAKELLGWQPPFSMLEELRWTMQQEMQSP